MIIIEAGLRAPELCLLRFELNVVDFIYWLCAFFASVEPLGAANIYSYPLAPNQEKYHLLYNIILTNNIYISKIGFGEIIHIRTIRVLSNRKGSRSMSKIVVVGANHAGTAAIKTILSNHPGHQVSVYDSNSNISFLGCGMALWIGAQIDGPEGLF